MKRLFIVFTVLLMLISCSDNEPSKPVNNPGNTSGTASDMKPTDSFSLCYSAEETLNPFKTASKFNLEIAPLLFDGLVRLDNNFQPVYRIAREIQSDGASCTVTIDDNIVFSDGTPLTAADVVYSFGAARASGSYYRARLAGASSAKADGTHTVRFALSSPDALFLSCLDFPVIKSGTDKNAACPIGSGRYVYVPHEISPTLQTNENHRGTAGQIKTINLLKIPDREALLHSVEVGTLSCYFMDFSDGTIPRINTTFAPVNINNFVYLGVNSKKEAFADPKLRGTIFKLLNRETISSKGYQGRALPAYTAFNPVFKPLESLHTAYKDENPVAAIAALTEMGYDSLDQNGVRKSKLRKMSYELIYTENNEMRKAAAQEIAAQLAAAGISLKLTALSLDNYKARLTGGNFDFYLAETKLTGNMDLSLLFSETGGLGFGFPAELTAPGLYAAYKSSGSAADLKAFLDAFHGELPFIPICYRQGLAAFNRGITGDFKVSQSDLFYDIEHWKMG